MTCESANLRFQKIALLLWVMLSVAAGFAWADQSVTLAWDPSPNTNVVGYKIYYGGASGVYTNTVTLGNVTSATIGGLVDGATYYLTATSVSATGDESAFSNEAMYSAPVNTNTVSGSVTNAAPLPSPSTNLPPSIDSIASVTVSQGGGSQTILVTGINPGSVNGTVVPSSSLTFSVVASDSSVVQSPAFNYDSANGTGSLNFTPGNPGMATVTLTVDNGAGTNSIATQTFTVTVMPALAPIVTGPPVSVPSNPPMLNTPTNVTVYQNSGAQTLMITGIDSRLSDGNQQLSLTVVANDSTILAAPVVTYTNGNDFATVTFSPVAGALGMATVTVTANNGAASNNLTSQTFSVTVIPNRPPTLNAISNITIFQNAGLQTIALTGITSGSASSNLTISATSSNPSLIPTPTVVYTSPNSSGTLTFTPNPTALGTANITVTGDNGALSSNKVVRTFVVTVVANPKVNQPPTLAPIASLMLIQGSGVQTVALKGISSGSPAENQVLRVTAISSNTRVVQTPSVHYTSPSSTGSLTFQPGNVGTSTITVSVNDGGKSNNIVQQSFTVTIFSNKPPTLNPISNVTLAKSTIAQTNQLTGISSGSPLESQTLRVTATSSNTRLVTTTIQYTSPSSNALLILKPSGTSTGSVTITVTVNDGGLNNNTITRQFTVTVATVAVAPASASIPANAAGVLTAVAYVPGQFAFQVSGIAGAKYAVQATSDLTHWTPVTTNTSPFTFQEPSTSGQRFYRTVYVP